MGESIVVVVVEPDPIRLEGIVSSINRGKNLRLLSAGESLMSAVKSFDRHPPNESMVVAVVNLGSQEIDFRFWLCLALIFPPDVRIVGMCGSKNRQALIQAFALRVGGLVTPDTQPDELYEAIIAVGQGSLYYSVQLLESLKDLLLSPLESNLLNSVTEDSRKTTSNAFAKMTAREKQVLSLVAKGWTNRKIGHELNISHRTVEYHVSNILRKLGVSSRIEAAIIEKTMVGRFIWP